MASMSKVRSVVSTVRPLVIVGAITGLVFFAWGLHQNHTLRADALYALWVIIPVLLLVASYLLLAMVVTAMFRRPLSKRADTVFRILGVAGATLLAWVMTAYVVDRDILGDWPRAWTPGVPDGNLLYPETTGETSWTFLILIVVLVGFAYGVRIWARIKGMFGKSSPRAKKVPSRHPSRRETHATADDDTGDMSWLHESQGSA